MPRQFKTKNSCELGSGSVILPNSCTGVSGNPSCAGTGANLFVGVGSCTGLIACADLSANNAMIGHGSCQEISACRAAGGRSSRITIGDGACIGPNNCFDFGGLTMDVDVTVGDGACVQGQSCVGAGDPTRRPPCAGNGCEAPSIFHVQVGDPSGCTEACQSPPV